VRFAGTVVVLAGGLEAVVDGAVDAAVFDPLELHAVTAVANTVTVTNTRVRTHALCTESPPWHPDGTYAFHLDARERGKRGATTLPRAWMSSTRLRAGCATRAMSSC
jgi:hypothetical protein